MNGEDIAGRGIILAVALMFAALFLAVIIALLTPGRRRGTMRTERRMLFPGMASADLARGRKRGQKPFDAPGDSRERTRMARQPRTANVNNGF